jgi:hypothetical protein
MQIEVHGLVAVIHKVDDLLLKLLIRVLGIDIKLYKPVELKNYAEYLFKFNNDKESVYIRVNKNNEEWYVLLIVNGSFFDNSPKCTLDQLLKFLSPLQHTLKQLDVAFNDNKKCLKMRQLKHWCKYYKDFCTGSMVARQAPRFETAEGKICFIKLQNARSKVNFATIYRRTDTGFLRIELKIKSNDKITYLLENYSSKKLDQFNTRSLETLVSCINFITGQSKRNGVLSKYKKQAAWLAFLESDIQKVKWSEVLKEITANRVKSDNATFDKRIRRQATMVNNMVKNLAAIHPEEDILKLFEANSGFKLVKKDEPDDENRDDV